ncbi:hypothetical protein SYNPS1DRAFT_30507 [Syncephalis pseudoplumigaleata]|uniref:BZIP domain-containing protein n=1 Tax=Syncephalis pseudoplumigaleata TaxID=1712513 RepID=A0A4P9YUS2_9FUNG|nr:hypothetical protein SYNPS1DRAFT_30507 [Syncephalis pseudoplumigaleata]|eukprot:RKP23736.1 hypothetical protein SYNPS1DRAFT_30507 [Syncephalis pseudoplumigaleata]
MAEVNPFDASFRRSNEAAAAAAAAAVVGHTDDNQASSRWQISVTHWQPPMFATAVDHRDQAQAASSSTKRKRSTSPTAKNEDAAHDDAYEHDGDEDDEDKRQKFLERNRVAAFKCRQKRKAWMQELETKSDEVTKRNKALHLLVNQLKEEAIQLKNQMLAHRDCDCNVIQRYVRTSGLFNNTNGGIGSSSSSAGHRGNNNGSSVCFASSRDHPGYDCSIAYADTTP